MKLEDLKAQLETEATRKNIEHEKTIRTLNKIINSLQDTITKREEVIASLSNRCFAVTHGSICSWCMIKGSCSSIFRKKELTNE